MLIDGTKLLDWAESEKQICIDDHETERARAYDILIELVKSGKFSIPIPDDVGEIAEALEREDEEFHITGRQKSKWLRSLIAKVTEQQAKLEEMTDLYLDLLNEKYGYDKEGEESGE